MYMKEGKLPEHTLSDYVLKNITGKNKSFIVPCVGNDYSLTDNEIVSDGFGANVKFAFYKAFNNFNCSLGNATGLRFLMLLPVSVKPSEIDSYVKELNELANIHSIAILGGHSEVLPDILSPKFYVTILGKRSEFEPARKKISTGCSILMVGYAGLAGTSTLIDLERTYLESKLPAAFLDSAAKKTKDCSINKATDVLSANMDFVTNEVFFLHDVSSSGIYAALWQMGKWMNKGFLIENKKIPIHQESIEICEKLNINPYLIDGMGALLIVCKNGYKLKTLFDDSKITSSVIGEITEGKERLIRLGPEDIRTLSPSYEDDIYNRSKTH